MEKIENWKEQIKKINHINLAKIILDESGYTKMWKKDKSIDAPGRLENLKELITAMSEFSTMNEFLEHISLVMENERNYLFEMVNIMTMHSAKGLEFENVFLAGWDEGLFPHQKSLEETGQKALEEERRLAYVGITRAKKNAFISFSMNRYYQGDWIDSMASRFIDELPEQNIEKNNFFEEKNDDDFEFNQDFETNKETRSPGWIRYLKRIK